MKAIYALEGGVAGAAALTLLHETIKKTVPNAPRMDLLAMNALSKGLKIVGARTPNERKLYGLSLTGDLLSNSIFYSFAGIGKKENALARGAALGLSHRESILKGYRDARPSFPAPMSAFQPCFSGHGGSHQPFLPFGVPFLFFPVHKFHNASRDQATNHVKAYRH